MIYKNKIIAAALLLEDNKIVSIMPPYRHNNILHLVYPIKVKEQGFLLNNGIFVNRIEAAKIAIESKQIKKLKYGPELFTEDLW
jgi:hypothetical protein